MKTKLSQALSSRIPKILLVSSTIAFTGCGQNAQHEHTSTDLQTPIKKQAQVAQQAGKINLRILETSDLHTNIMDYDYYQSRVDPRIGLARTASLIKQHSNVDNVVLVDNGDLLQGSPMGDFIAHGFKHSNRLTDTHPAYKAMNTLNYSVGNIGNHEFNYGLDFLKQALSGAEFPYISANVLCKSDCWDNLKPGDNLFKPYLIEQKTVTDEHGNQHQLNIGYIGFVPPQILLWDKQNLDGRVDVLGIVESAEKFIPQMKAEGADIIVAIPHSGVGTPEAPTNVNDENATWALTLVDDIDAITFGHSHSVFPSATFEGLTGADLDKGTINGVAAVMPGRWGDNLGLIDLTLEQDGDSWKVVDSRAKALPIFDSKAASPELVAADASIHKAIAKEHQQTIDYVSQPIGHATSDMYSYLSLVQDDPTVQIVANAQIWKLKQNLPQQLKHLPVLSAASPFKAGGRHSTSADKDSYVQVAKGKLTYKNAADLYLYPNTLVAVKVTGAQVKDWLECSANQFNQIDPSSTAPQSLINWNDHRTYNFDVIDGEQGSLTYQIDVTQPNRFDGNCKLVDANANRIKSLSYMQNGKLLSGDAFAKQEFIVASNNYRAFGQKFAGTGSKHVVLELPDTNREALAQYISAETEKNGSVDPGADNNWDFANISTNTKLDIRFETQSSEQAEQFIKQYQQRKMTKLNDTDELGFAVYQIDLTEH
ncbi:bifunctional 2',3'-cyclic-nucleotide 2'-phosphodiesterase/3'-nucleotidase [Shewanella maritima]|uniref:Bifunctional 2',3'-cyclic-nucleotide 2'-phosphodiesterase/3'-nucleotidase n=1 Tax=Shewanella maritima TaxID=2520507 RepID=A0A411PLT5_9GAMM|nr:bifunctional 2',3'-cyclic-nucleotide 2'-phosphodiesterase/3'-nucleotidase [Shewanella maritima]QBF84448.1 bifunctional 2',3'-cyclic-nucleotide 2'-phosphodiesterase/3'-nucleotidase [Shewanella maritima]